MPYHGCLTKMRTSLPEMKRVSLELAADDAPAPIYQAQYQLALGEDELDVNSWLGKKIKINYTGNIFCVHCHKKTSKSFAQGYCFMCFRRLAECDMCIIKPEKCHYEQGTCRDNDWAHEHCMQSHVVYLANSSGVKVGITRLSNVPSRWIDQGAVAAIPVIQVSNRYQSGMIEVTLAQYVNDKTNWRKMLKNEVEEVDLIVARDRLLQQTDSTLKDVISRFKHQGVEFIQNPYTYRIAYPVIRYPEKVSSLSLDKQPEIEGVVQGIKGQYLLLDIGVMNIRKFSGYEVSLEIV